jgi:hypothetical protein
LVLAQRQRQLAIVVAVTGEHVEGVELHLAIVFAKVQGVEVGIAGNAKNNRLGVEHEMRLPDLKRRLDDSRIAVGPVAAPRDQARAIVLPDDQYAVAVELDLREPVRTGGDLRRPGRRGTRTSPLYRSAAARLRIRGLASIRDEARLTQTKIARSAANENPLTTIVNVSMRLSPSRFGLARPFTCEHLHHRNLTDRFSR